MASDTSTWGHRATDVFTHRHGAAWHSERTGARVDLNQQDIDDDVLVHTFEKVETAEEFCGVTRTPDGADELALHAEAIDALDLRDVVRSHTRTRSIYRADVTLDVAVGEVEAAETSDTTRFLYDEWDAKARRYKQAWCRVYVTRPTQLATSSAGRTYATDVLRKHAKHVRDLRTAFDRLRAVRVLKNRQPDGGDVDMDALIDRYATCAAVINRTISSISCGDASGAILLPCFSWISALQLTRGSKAIVSLMWPGNRCLYWVKCCPHTVIR